MDNPATTESQSQETTYLCLAKRAYSKCRKSFTIFIKHIALEPPQFNERENIHLHQLHAKWKSAHFLNSELQLFFDMKEHHDALNNSCTGAGAGAGCATAWQEYIDMSDLFRLQIMMAIGESL